MLKIKCDVSGTHSVPVPGMKIWLMTELTGPIQVVVKLTVGKRTEIDYVPRKIAFYFEHGTINRAQKVTKMIPNGTLQGC